MGEHQTWIEEGDECFVAFCACGWFGTLRGAVRYAEDDAREHLVGSGGGQANAPSHLQ